ncbi:MAG: hypothetical protein AAB515_01805 [Patescibacteria group bacterium]
MKALVGLILVLTLVNLASSTIGRLQSNKQIDALQAEVRDAVIIPEGDMLLKQIANYAVGYYHTNGEWPSGVQISDLGPGACTRHWYFQSVNAMASEGMHITIRKYDDAFGGLSAIVHPDSTVSYIPRQRFRMPMPVRAS